eukprot:Clim_evm2s78 gene=Clim_evmTU2s78
MAYAVIDVTNWLPNSNLTIQADQTVGSWFTPNIIDPLWVKPETTQILSLEGSVGPPDSCLGQNVQIHLSYFEDSEPPSTPNVKIYTDWQGDDIQGCGFVCVPHVTRVENTGDENANDQVVVWSTVTQASNSHGKLIPHNQTVSLCELDEFEETSTCRGVDVSAVRGVMMPRQIIPDINDVSSMTVYYNISENYNATLGWNGGGYMWTPPANQIHLEQDSNATLTLSNAGNCTLTGGPGFLQIHAMNPATGHTALEYDMYFEYEMNRNLKCVPQVKAVQSNVGTQALVWSKFTDGELAFTVSMCDKSYYSKYHTCPNINMDDIAGVLL